MKHSNRFIRTSSFSFQTKLHDWRTTASVQKLTSFACTHSRFTFYDWKCRFIINDNVIRNKISIKVTAFDWIFCTFSHITKEIIYYNVAPGIPLLILRHFIVIASKYYNFFLLSFWLLIGRKCTELRYCNLYIFVPMINRCKSVWFC